jgi:pimeloyl-ACP methyl ester carboxylesterase
MRFSRHGSDGEDLLFVLGWGNEPDHDHVAWLLERLVDAGYRVHAVTLPTNVWDFDDQYLAPVREYAADRGFDVVLSHSTGGLVAAHLAADLDVRNVYLSPWWGMSPAEGFESVVYPYFLRVPTARRLVRPERDPVEIGDLKTESEMESQDAGGLSPAFLRTIRDAQSRLPPLDDDAVVFCTLVDSVVSVRAIGRRTPTSNLRPYDGGHEFFSSSGRERVFEDVRAALDSGPDALR